MILKTQSRAGIVPSPVAAKVGRVGGQVRRMKPELTRLPGIIAHISTLSSNFSTILCGGSQTAYIRAAYSVGKDLKTAAQGLKSLGLWIHIVGFEAQH
jgi:hypothetical protein